MYFEEIFNDVGAIGIYQLFLMGYVFALGLVSIDALRMNFVGGYMQHWCRIPGLENFTHDQQKDIAIPSGDGREYSSCYRFPLDFNQYSTEDLLNWNRTERTDGIANADLVKCDAGWTFDQSYYISTIGSQWSLVCDDEWKVQLSSTLYMAGWLTGGILTGPLSDRFGRKAMMMACHTIRCIGAYVCLYSPTYEGFAVGQVIMGITSPSATLALYIIVAEVTGRKWRAAFGVAWHIMLFSFGGMVIPAIAYFVRDHFKLMAVFFWPLGLFFVLFVFVDESPRWLVARSREKEAVAILNHMAKVNKGPKARLPEDVHFKEEGIAKESQAQKTGSPADLFRTPNLRKKTCIIWLQWFTISLVYYGLSLNVGRLPGSIHLNSFLLSGIELPGYLMGIFLLERIGRKKTTGGSTMLAGLSTILCIPFLLSSNLEDVATYLSIVGKGAAAAGFAAIYVYTAELYPTNIRNIALGSASMIARVSGMAAPFVGGPMVDVWAGLPSLCYGVLGLFSGALVFLLPETVGMKLPETIEEAEAFGKKNTRPDNVIFKMKVAEENGSSVDIEDAEEEKECLKDLLEQNNL